MKEISPVEENKHLRRNLPALAQALFGDDAYLLRGTRVPDSMTGKGKISDGFLWLPWKRQLLVVEVEWKLANYPQQSWAFAKSDPKPIKKRMKTVAADFPEVLCRLGGGIREDHVMDCLVGETINKYLKEGHLRLPIWMVLGHEGNPERLRESYLERLNGDFPYDDTRRKQGFILSMARMFQGPFSACILIEQHRVESNEFRELFPVPDALVVPALPASEAGASVPPPAPEDPKASGRSVVGDPPKFDRQAGSTGTPVGTGKKRYDVLRRLCREKGRGEPSPSDIHLQVEIKGVTKYFAIDWGASLETILVRDQESRSARPARAVKERFGKNALREWDHVARRYGRYVLFSDDTTEPVEIARYSAVEQELKTDVRTQHGN